MLRSSLVFLLVFVSSLAFSQDITLIFTRHAEKAKSESRDPELSDKGVERAAKLAETLSEIPITAIYSTDYKRTRNTVIPTAESKDLEVTLYDPRNREFLAEMIKKEKGGVVLVSGHSNTIPSMINQAAQTNYPNFSEEDYDDLVIVILKPENEPTLIWLKQH